eukprot:COSAG06_NODE_41_length_30044_cov_24.608382_7_plen_197_part_00
MCSQVSAPAPALAPAPRPNLAPVGRLRVVPMHEHVMSAHARSRSLKTEAEIFILCRVPDDPFRPLSPSGALHVCSTSTARVCVCVWSRVGKLQNSLSGDRENQKFTAERPATRARAWTAGPSPAARSTVTTTGTRPSSRCAMPGICVKSRARYLAGVCNICDDVEKAIMSREEYNTRKCAVRGLPATQTSSIRKMG